MISVVKFYFFCSHWFDRCASSSLEIVICTYWNDWFCLGRGLCILLKEKMHSGKSPLGQIHPDSFVLKLFSSCFNVNKHSISLHTNSRYALSYRICLHLLRFGCYNWKLSLTSDLITAMLAPVSMVNFHFSLPIFFTRANLYNSQSRPM